MLASRTQFAPITRELFDCSGGSYSSGQRLSIYTSAICYLSSARFSFTLVLVLLAIICAGCQQSISHEAEYQRRLAIHDQAEQKKREKKPGQTKVLAASTSSHQDSPAQLLALDSLNADSNPETVCHAFLNALQIGDQISAQQLLTEQAIVETSRANLELAPPGGPKATFEVLTARYDTQKRQNSQVDCIVRQDSGDQAGSFRLTWLLRRQLSGWKIMGMKAENADDGQIDLLSFESPDDVARIKSSLSDELDATTSRELRQARSPDESTGRLK